MVEVTGLVAQVENQSSHQKFVSEANPNSIIISLTDALQLVNKGKTAESYFGNDITIVVTSTINDTELNKITWENELNIVRSFKPHIHIPTDYSIYKSHSHEQRIKKLVNCMQGTEWMKNNLEEYDVDILPLVKGFTRSEREVCYFAINQMEFDTVAYYCTQYFTGGQGNNIDELVNDVKKINNETNFNVFLIGLTSPQYLERMPPCVVAASGMNQWLTLFNETKDGGGDISHTYGNLDSDVRSSLEI